MADDAADRDRQVLLSLHARVPTGDEEARDDIARLLFERLIMLGCFGRFAPCFRKRFGVAAARRPRRPGDGEHQSDQRQGN